MSEDPILARMDQLIERHCVAYYREQARQELRELMADVAIEQMLYWTGQSIGRPLWVDEIRARFGVPPSEEPKT